MSDIKSRLTLFLRCNRALLKYWSIVWALFLVGIVVSNIFFKRWNVASAIYLGMLTSMASITAALPVVNQYSIFPHCISLGWSRKEFIVGNILFNIFIIALMALIVNIIFPVGDIGSFLLVIPGMGALYTRLLYSCYGIGLSGVLMIFASVSYKYDLSYGISLILLLTSPLLLFRHYIFDYLKWNSSGFQIGAYGVLLIGAVCMVFSWLFIRKAELRA